MAAEVSETKQDVEKLEDRVDVTEENVENLGRQVDENTENIQVIFRLNLSVYSDICHPGTLTSSHMNESRIEINTFYVD